MTGGRRGSQIPKFKQTSYVHGPYDGERVRLSGVEGIGEAAVGRLVVDLGCNSIDIWNFRL